MYFFSLSHPQILIFLAQLKIFSLLHEQSVQVRGNRDTKKEKQRPTYKVQRDRGKWRYRKKERDIKTEKVRERQTERKKGRQRYREKDRKLETVREIERSFENEESSV